MTVDTLFLIFSCRNLQFHDCLCNDVLCNLEVRLIKTILTLFTRLYYIIIL